MNDSLCKEGYKTKPKEKKSQNLEKQTERSQGKDIVKIKQQERLTWDEGIFCRLSQ